MASFTCLTASLSARPLLPAGASSITVRSSFDKHVTASPNHIASATCCTLQRSTRKEVRLAPSELWGRSTILHVEGQTWNGAAAACRRQRHLLTRAAVAAVAVSKSRVISLVVAVGLPLIVGSANAIINNPNTSFYTDLKKPSFNPPNWLFGLAWGLLYPVMGLASWLVWSEGGFKQQAIPLTSYVIQLVLNLLWPPIFFTAHKLQGALVDLAALVVAVAVTAFLFKPVNPLAFYLFLPYLAWVAFATFLNYKYVTLNSSAPAAGDQPQPA